MCNISPVIFLTVVLIFVVVCCDTTFRPIYPSGLSEVSLVYLGIEIIQPEKSILKFDC